MTTKQRPKLTVTLTMHEAVAIVEALQVQLDGYRDELGEATSKRARRAAASAVHLHDALICKVSAAAVLGATT